MQVEVLSSLHDITQPEAFSNKILSQRSAGVGSYWVPMSYQQSIEMNHIRTKKGSSLVSSPKLKQKTLRKICGLFCNLL